MEGYQGDQIFYSDASLVNKEDTENPNRIKSVFMRFVSNFKRGAAQPQKDILLMNQQNRKQHLDVSLEDLHSQELFLQDMLTQKPDIAIRACEEGLRDWITYQNNCVGANIPLEASFDNMNWQLVINTSQLLASIRNLTAAEVNKMVLVKGIVVSCSKTAVKATNITIKCRKCGWEHVLVAKEGQAGLVMPRFCGNTDNQGQSEACPPDPFNVITELCDQVDTQHVKLQEQAEDIPSGEIPKHISVQLDRSLTDILSPGNRVNLVGIWQVIGDKGSAYEAVKMKRGELAVKASYLRGLGFVQTQKEAVAFTFTKKDETSFHQMASDPYIQEKVCKSIAPAIYGMDDIKRAVACMLFGGTSKVLPDNIRLRGDIHTLLLGDPSTAKSQFLKFAQTVAPVSVQTSGKGSSAAGLTASVLKNHTTGEFQLEAGALVLGDGGTVCIDEFDKMRPQDRVAIHEAMEQQTISIAKAGITALLNARTGILAAANPNNGRQDDLTKISDQIDFQTSILSRFDCIFLVRDTLDAVKDKMLAEHVIKLHSGIAPSSDVQNTAVIPVDELKRQIAQARQKCQPRLTKETVGVLSKLWVRDRYNTKEAGIPVTVRQLEALVRLSEAIAKMALSEDVLPSHVAEAHRIFKVSTLNAAEQGGSHKNDQNQEQTKVISDIEEAVLKRIQVGQKMATTKIFDEMLTRFNNVRASQVALSNLIKRGELETDVNKKFITRKQ